MNGRLLLTYTSDITTSFTYSFYSYAYHAHSPLPSWMHFLPGASSPIFAIATPRVYRAHPATRLTKAQVKCIITDVKMKAASTRYEILLALLDDCKVNIGQVKP